MKNFYLIFDNDNYRIGIAIKVGSSSVVQEKSHGYLIAIIVVIIVIVLGCGGYCFWKKKQIRMREQMKEIKLND